MVVAGLNSPSRYWTPCSLRASRMLRWLKESAKGSPWSRAKRARTSDRVVHGGSRVSGCEGGRPGGATAGPARTKDARAGIAPRFHCTRSDLTTNFALQLH
jgi:hypothetical protein